MADRSLSTVFLVGAGPGDPELITLKAIRVLQKADVVLYDFLAHPNLLRYCSTSAELVCVGKRRGNHRKTQDEIHELLIRYADKGLKIVRLKGGDPFLFGRGGEEIDFLKKFCISYEIVPGISSTLAGPAYAGFSLTHRDHAQSVAFVTGVPKAGDSVDSLLLPEADTIVVVMPITHLAELCQRFSRHSRFSHNTPAMLQYKATTSDQAILKGTLETLPSLAEDTQWPSPSLLVIGDVLEKQEAVSWREKLPLFGKRIVMLRSVSQGKALTQTLQSLGAEVFSIPVIEIVSRETDHRRITSDFLYDFSYVIFTSPNGVRQFMLALSDSCGDSRFLYGKKLVAIGPKTAKVLSKYGLQADIVPVNYKSEGVLSSLPYSMSGENVLIPTALKTRNIIVDDLVSRGAKVTKLPLYETQLPYLPDHDIRDGDYVVFTSSSMARHFFESDLYDGQSLYSFCIGDVTAETVRSFVHDHIFVAAASTENHLKEVILEVAQNEREGN